MDIKRVDGYDNKEFSQNALLQHGCYTICGKPYEVEITSASSAVVRGENSENYLELIEYFRFHAPHICLFYNEGGDLIAEYSRPQFFEISLAKIQPSQFYIDIEKLNAVRTFIKSKRDIVIQVIPWGERYIALDGHTRLYLAGSMGFSSVFAVLSETDDWVWKFVEEARRRGVCVPANMTLLSHEEYLVQWDAYCDSVFASEQ